MTFGRRKSQIMRLAADARKRMAKCVLLFFPCPYFYEISAGMMRQKRGFSYGSRVEGWKSHQILKKSGVLQEVLYLQWNWFNHHKTVVMILHDRVHQWQQPDANPTGVIRPIPVYLKTNNKDVMAEMSKTSNQVFFSVKLYTHLIYLLIHPYII